ncbi:helicase [Thiohalorhabdus denitrificans]|uniref:Helicase conserved C-terminal domain-containing protein n=1 Tax=Thiohalorhabdus denitrificans TaxID=381306 RepID=A0A0P9CTE3_9GAMM|nr:helicase-related protein [Thiohalorhabdus denitrificans]KPV39929.1 helicase [Thiohalorhabdus denitrificans]SCY08824.1 Helicase conserved C-terminal domain-containing protein [Thiohalorhabdus denitrificans]
MSRPDPEAILAPLKSFQRRTVDHAFHRLFEAEGSTRRFLVADEVGLGKTLVARGIIARGLDHLWDTTDRIDVIYICSNQNIARSNLPKLQVTGQAEDAEAHATRLTMLATEMAPEKRQADGKEGSLPKANFVSFTPGTSFDLRSSGGKSEERQVLYWLLEEVVPAKTGLKNLLQGWVGTERWRQALRSSWPLEPGIKERFQQRVQADERLLGELEAAIDRWFLQGPEGYPNGEYPDEARRKRDRLTGQLRQHLAEVCIEALEPDLVILDEFQRFKTLVNQDEAGPDAAAKLAQRLFHTRNARGEPVHTLLLSATPYKLYTADAEEEDNHYRDFLATTRFLLDYDEVRVAVLEERLAAFGRELKRAAKGQSHDVVAARQAAEECLQAIMARTERVAASDEQDAMVEEHGTDLSLAPGDVRQYLAADAWFTAVGDRDPMAYWKAGPYLPHFMQGYKVNERVREAREGQPDKLKRVLDSYPDAFLDRNALARWERMDPSHAKLRSMVNELLDTGLWKLLWMPPSLPYWSLGGPFQGQDHRTKTLLFSAWNFVPDVVSGVLSYEAERRMTGGALKDYWEQRSPLLRLGEQNRTRSRHRLLLLLMPSTVLADCAHPLAAPEGADVRGWVRGRIEAMLGELDWQADPAEEPDPRWEYMAPLLLDPGLRDFLQYWASASPEETGKPNPDVLPAYLQDLLELDPASLGPQPEGLAEHLTDLALGAPGVIATRTLGSAALSDQKRRTLATRFAQAYWNLFNRPAVMSLLEQLEGREGALGEHVYWRRVLRYCIDGNLQAVMDETWHLAWEQHAWSKEAPADKVAEVCVEELAARIDPRPTRVHAHFLQPDGNGGLEPNTLRIRTTFAQRFGDLRTEEGMVSQDAIRAAFNSPFRPFVLTSTSVGQEGLDFHPWCHRLVHWNLPGNPVDLEQREGRIHRYKGHAVRRNVADQFGKDARAGWAPGADLWELLFSVADRSAREKGANDLIPFWIAPGPFKVQRHVPALPYTREVEAFRRLKHQLATYRVVFGQPRQEELLTMLGEADVSTEQLSEWTIQLSPTRALLNPGNMDYP